MRISIQIRGALARKISDPFEIKIDKGSNLRHALQYLIDKESKIREVWASPEDIERDALILRNNVDVSLTGELDSPVKDGDLILIIPLIHGGVSTQN